MEFECRNEEAQNRNDQSWNGSVEGIQKNGNIVEAKILGKGSAMHVIIGEYQYGRYLCIPRWGIGSDLSELKDRFWNRERLEQILSRADAITISEALKSISEEMEGTV
ncbi:MAG: DUF6618 family protein [Lachnospiraceae bacterium]